MKMNIPTRLTFLRIFMIPLFVALFFIPFEGNTIAATAVFILACLTDQLDGHLARKWNQVTTLGKFLDPIADKLLVACALIAVLFTPQISAIFTTVMAVMTMIILCRELFVSGFRIVASSKNIVLAADKLGKIKTVCQMIALILLLPCADVFKWGGIVLWTQIWFYVGFGFLAIATVLTVISGLNYIIPNRSVLFDDNEA